MELISEQEYNDLRKIVFSKSEVETRLRAQVVVLYEKEFKPNKITSIVEKSLDEVYNLLQFVDFFGLEDYLNISYADLKSRVNDEIFLREQRKARQKRKGFFYYLFWPITSIFKTIYHFGGIVTALLAWFYSLFTISNSPSKNSNTATFEEGASNNYLIQINHLTINKDEENESVEVERIVTNSQWQLQDKIKEIIASEEEITFNDSTVDSLIISGRRKNINGELDKSRIHLYASLIVAYLIYSSSFKGGIWTIGVFGVAIAISFEAWFPNNEIATPTNPSDTIAYTNTHDEVLDVQSLDSIRTKIEDNQAVEIYDYRTYYSIIDDFYESDNLCNALSAVGEKQKKFIYEYDKLDHTLQEYYIDNYDKKYYVHVVAYTDIREAAFQMHYLNSTSIFDAEVLRVDNSNKILYAVVIGEYNGYQIKEICELIERWAIHCLNRDVEIGCYYNG